MDPFALRLWPVEFVKSPLRSARSFAVVLGREIARERRLAVGAIVNNENVLRGAFTVRPADAPILERALEVARRPGLTERRINVGEYVSGEDLVHVWARVYFDQRTVGLGRSDKTSGEYFGRPFFVQGTVLEGLRRGLTWLHDGGNAR